MNRPDSPTPWPVSKPQTEAGKKGAALHAEWVKQYARVEQVETDYAAARAEVKAAEEAIANAESAKAAGEAEKAYVAAKAALDGPWQARLQGPVNASHKAEGALREHVTASLAELLSEPELGDAAEDARASVIEATEALAAAFDEWRRVSGAHRAVVKLADGIDARTIPGLSPAAKAAAGAIEQMLNAETSSPTVGTHALRAPRVELNEETWHWAGVEY